MTEGGGKGRGRGGRPACLEDDCPITRIKIQGFPAVIPDIVYRESSSLAFSDSHLWIPAKNLRE